MSTRQKNTYRNTHAHTSLHRQIPGVDRPSAPYIDSSPNNSIHRISFPSNTPCPPLFSNDFILKLTVDFTNDRTVLFTLSARAVIFPGNQTFLVKLLSTAALIQPPVYPVSFSRDTVNSSLELLKRNSPFSVSPP